MAALLEILVWPLDPCYPCLSGVPTVSNTQAKHYREVWVERRGPHSIVLTGHGVLGSLGGAYESAFLFFIVVLSFRPGASCTLNTFLLTLCCISNQASISKPNVSDDFTTDLLKVTFWEIPSTRNIVTCILKPSSIHDFMFPECLQWLFT